MADRASSKNPRTISSLLGSPRFFNGVLVKTLSDGETAETSPTSILDTKNLTSPFGPEISNQSCRKPEAEAIGLALIDSINEEKNDENAYSRPINRLSVLGSKLKIQIPTATDRSSSTSPPPLASPADFGIKTRNSQLLSPICGTPDKSFTRQLSLKEMELSEDYTCVITHGPIPRTTHIFDDCIVENTCQQKTEIDASASPSANFLGLDQGKDACINGEETK